MKRTIVKTISVLILTAFFLAVFSAFCQFPKNAEAATAAPFEFETKDDNTLVVTFYDNFSGSSTGWKYKTAAWYMHAYKMHGNEYDLSKDDYDSLGAVRVETSTEEVAPSGLVERKLVISPEDVTAWLMDYYEKEGLGDISQLAIDASRPNKQFTIFLSRSFYIYDGSNPDKTYGPYYSYPGMVDGLQELAGASWGGKTKEVFRKQSYDKALPFTLRTTHFSVVLIDESTGKEIQTVNITNVPRSVYLYGETISEISAEAYDDQMAGYDYMGYEWKRTTKAGKTEIIDGRTGQDKDAGELPLTQEVLGEQSIKDGEAITLYFFYRPAEGASSGTTPVTTPTPTKKVNAYWHTDKYFTTSEGYTLDDLANDGGNKLASAGALNSTKIKDHTATQRVEEFALGTDSHGNTWYFIPNGKTATYVHPAVYQNYNASGATVRNIHELTFPAVVTCEGKNYTVTHIGGGGATYHTVAATDKDMLITYDYGVSNGWRRYNPDLGSNYMHHEYWYGVLGNGGLTSYGARIDTAGAIQESYSQNYYVYNTTLREITIPDTVTEIGEYAFMYCEALTTIHGGGNVTKIAENAFRSERDKDAKISSQETVDVAGISKDIKNYYYYNGYCSTTTKSYMMSRWESDVAFYSARMALPEFPRLVTIGENTFANHTNLMYMELPASVTAIHRDAFSGCELTYISVPNKQVIFEGKEETLGSKGNVTDKTVIYTEADAVNVIAYGRKYSDFYTLQCGYQITYNPNGVSGQPHTETATLVNKEVNFRSGGSISDSLFYGVEWDGSFWLFSAKAGNGIVVSDSFGKLEGIPTPEKILFAVNVIDNYSEAGESYYYPVVMVYEDANEKVWRLDAAATMNASEYVWKYTLTSVTDLGITKVGPEELEWDAVFYHGTNRYALTATATFVDGSSYVWNETDGEKLTLAEEDNFLAREIYYRHSVYGELKAGYAEDKTIYYRISDWTKLSNAKLPTASASDCKAIWYLDSIPFGVSTSGQVAFKISGTARTAGEGINGDIVFGESFIKTNGSGKDYYSVIQNSAGEIFLFKTYSSYLSRENYRVFKNLGAVDGAITEVIFDTGYSAAVGTMDVAIIIRTDTGGLYYVAATTTSKSSAYKNSVADMIQLGGDDVWFEQIYTEYVGNEYLWNGKTSKYEATSGRPLYVVALAADGTIWTNRATGKLDELTNISNGHTFETVYADFYNVYDGSVGFWEENWEYTGMTQFLGIYAIGTDGKFYEESNMKMVSSGVEALAILNRSFVLTETGMHLHGSVYNEEQDAWYEFDEEEYIPDIGYYFETYISPNLFFGGTHTFSSWNTKANGSGTVYHPGERVTVTQDMELFANWEVKQGLCIRFDANGGHGNMPDLMMASGKLITLPENTFWWDGYVFQGWNTKADGTGVRFNDESSFYIADGTYILYAQWEELVVSYDIVYMKYPFGTPGNTSWQQVSMVTGADKVSTEIIKGEPYTVNGCVVSYNLNNKEGKLQLDSTAFYEGLTDQNTKTKAAVFEAWECYCMDENGEPAYFGIRYTEGEEVSRLTKRDGDVIYLYPVWSGADSFVLLPDASCEGHFLAGWSETADGTGVVYPGPDMAGNTVAMFSPVKDTVLYAVWEAEEVMVDFRITDTDWSAGKKILANGSQALELPFGCGFEFAFDFGQTVTDTEAKISPHFYLLSKGDYEEVSLYYHVMNDDRMVCFVEAGSRQDTSNGFADGVIKTSDGMGSFFLPVKTYVVREENTENFLEYARENPILGNEYFFEKEGILVVSFEVYLTEKTGKEIYYNGWETTTLAKSLIESGWEYRIGDIIRYQLGKTVSEAYEIGGVE